MTEPSPVDREADGRERILSVAVQILESRGEAALRIAEVAEAAGVALGLVSYHFGGRDGLIIAAQQRRFAGLVREDGAAFQRILDDLKTPDDLVAALSDLSRAVLDSRRAQIRLSRIAAIAATFGREDAYVITGEIVDQLLADYSAHIQQAQSRGLIRADLDTRAIATFVQSYALGLVIFDLDPASASTQKMHEVIMAALAGFMAPPVSD
ncbi:MAG: TetR/AcrR family transcriptional regulator [Nitriliruptoraceae bacterium]